MKKSIIKPAVMILLLFVVAFYGCKKDEPVNQDQKSIENEIALDVYTDGAQLTKDRIIYYHEPLFDDYYNSFLDGTKFKESNEVIEGDLFMLIADVASPVRSGSRILSATHVAVEGDHAYVSYHYNEPNSAPMSAELYEGQIDVINIEDPTMPVIEMSGNTNRADFNTMFLDYEGLTPDRKLWLGASDYGVGGAVFELGLMDGVIPVGGELQRFKTASGSSVNGLAKAGDWLYATAGRTTGGSFSFEADDMSLVGSNEYSNAKYAAVSGPEAMSKHVVLRSGNSAELLVYNVSEGHELINTIDVGSIQPETGKSGILVKEDVCWVSAGYNGLKAFNLESGELVHTLSPASMVPEAVVNGVAMDNDYVYVAAGSAGMYICEIVPGQAELLVVERYDYGASANYINVGNSLIFIANGKEGLKILRRVPPGDYEIICDYDEKGVPFCIEENPDPLCPDLMGHLDVALPENQNALIAHPEYFTYPKTLVLSEEATVYITFIDEGAGWKNSLGTYTYPAGEPPVSTDDINNKLLVYPNASRKNRGGDLEPGATMRLLGSYPAGTTLGAFLVAHSWVGLDNAPGGLTEGFFTHYTNENLNINGLQQSLIFYDESCDAIILTFEDNKIPAGDKDFNDCIFKVIVDPPSAVDVSQFIPLGE